MLYEVITEDDPLSLARGDAGAGTAETGVPTQADFDEDQGVSLAADQVDLAAAAPEIARHDAQAALLEEARGEDFGPLPRAGRGIVVGH